MKSILLINASNRKRNTYGLLKSVEVLLQHKGYKTELITLSDYKIDFCKGCQACILKEGCMIKDDVALIMQKIIESDGLVIGTPVYLNNMSGILKAFIDRTCSWFHRSKVAQKPTLILVDTQGSGIKNTLHSIEEVVIQWGVARGGKISRKGRKCSEPIKEEEIEFFLKLLKDEDKKYKPSFKEVYSYNIKRVLAANVFPIDKRYWMSKGWLQEAYFPTVKLNIIKKVYGNVLYKFLCKVIKPNDN